MKAKWSSAHRRRQLKVRSNWTTEACEVRVAVSTVLPTSEQTGAGQSAPLPTDEQAAIPAEQQLRDLNLKLQLEKEAQEDPELPIQNQQQESRPAESEQPSIAPSVRRGSLLFTKTAYFSLADDSVAPAEVDEFFAGSGGESGATVFGSPPAVDGGSGSSTQGSDPTLGAPFISVGNQSLSSPPAATGTTLFNTAGSNASPTGTSFSQVQTPATQLSAAMVEQLLSRAAGATSSNDAIIAIVDRQGNILGVRVEDGVAPMDQATLTFAIDGAVAKARTGAFFGNDAAPLTSRTIRNISQTTITQREVESNPSIPDGNSTIRGPGFVAPIGLGGHFPPEVEHTPPVDLFKIEGTNRDGFVLPGPDGIIGAGGDDINIATRFNAPFDAGQDIPPPVSYGVQSGLNPNAVGRGIATLPGGLPIILPDATGTGRVVGGIGVFFPGRDGFATFEQGFIPGVGQTENQRNNAPKVLESEFIAIAALGGITGAGQEFVVGAIGGVAPVGTVLPFGRIDLVGINLQLYGPTAGIDGVKALFQLGNALGRGNPNSGTNQPIGGGATSRAGLAIPDGYLVSPRAGGGLTAADVQRIIEQGIAEANRVRAAIRLPISSRTRMVFCVTDLDGNILGLFRMADATVFSVDVAVAKARNAAYYADNTAIQPQDQVPGVPAGTAFSARTFRFLSEPRFPSGVDETMAPPFSILNDPGINRLTAENIGPALPANVYQTVVGRDAFNPGTNFRDPSNLNNQNGIVFFPGSTPLYKNGMLVGGLGTSGDGVDQDDVVNFSAASGFTVPDNVFAADDVFVNGVRLPFIKFLRNPRG